MAYDTTNDFAAWMDRAPRNARPEPTRSAELWREIAEFSARHPGVSVADAVRAVERSVSERSIL